MPLRDVTFTEITDRDPGDTDDNRWRHDAYRDLLGWRYQFRDSISAKGVRLWGTCWWDDDGYHHVWNIEGEDLFGLLLDNLTDRGWQLTISAAGMTLVVPGHAPLTSRFRGPRALSQLMHNALTLGQSSVAA